ncbi:hypothetical protein FISHEDRAFT_47477 [Fistulina hepatica ATCC 64428]|uniref:Uncharacterized protein n=1 Tax=Fistulina hepatica ATCC 64428 TaxID=1128425 RepID=A0A0D7A5R6_9AGAR|nr:hypothetical protein FISHEDRAFT_47477 [Fistulina hepatica ATCC 64428]
MKFRNKGFDAPRPGSSESSDLLLPRPRSGSVVYHNFQHSLNSLHDILDRDDRESLARLHSYLNELDDSATPLQAQDEHDKRSSRSSRRNTISSVKSVRRRSLPISISSGISGLDSLSFEYPEFRTQPDVTDFQWRRRKATKLTQFFGVDYRDLIDDVLESFENGLEYERKRGTINQEEAQVSCLPALLRCLCYIE